MEFRLIFSLIAIINLLMAIWGYTEGKLEMIEAMLETTEKGIFND